MKEIVLSKGYKSIVDDEDFERVSKYKWHYDGHYAVTSVKINGIRKTLSMHRLVNNTPNGLDTDHINRNGLDNRKENLRNCTRSQNGYNRIKAKNNTTGFKGIYRRSVGSWQAKIKFRGDRIYLGSFKTAEEAARAYDEKAKELYGEFANLNYPL